MLLCTVLQQFGLPPNPEWQITFASRPKKLALQIGGVALGVASFAAAFSAVEAQDLWVVIRDSLNPFLILAVIAWALSILCLCWRWRAMVSAEKPVSFWSALRLQTLAQWLNLFFPLRAGEGVMVVSASRKWQMRKSYLTAIFVNERVLNVVMTVALAFGLAYVIPDLAPYRLWLLCGVLVLLGYGLWVFGYRRGGDAARAKENQQPRERRDSNFWSGLQLLTSQRMLRHAVLSSLGAWFFTWIAILLLLLAVSPHQILLSAWAVLVFINLASILPLTPANLGPFQWACIVALSFFGIARAEALGVSLVLQGVRFGSIGFLAAALWLERLVFGRPDAAQAAG